MQQLSEITRLLGPDLEAMNTIISASLATSNPMMNEVVTTYLSTKGKQIRPIMVLLSARLFAPVNDNVLNAAASLEMLHNASLIHDDVVDETMLRRGVPTLNFRWGNHVAVLVGDFFVSKALEVGIRTGHIVIIRSLSELGAELSLGEIDQVSIARSHQFSEEGYMEVIRKKTASLFVSCVRMGCEAAGVPEDAYKPLLEYGRLLGLCFQIKDDIFDYFSDEKIGKPTGNDLREGKVTLPLIHALATAPEKESAPMRELLEKEELAAEEIQRLIAFAIAQGGIDYAFRKMRDMQAQADRCLDPLPDGEAKEAFRKIFEFIISRDR